MPRARCITVTHYKHLSPKDPQSFNRWLLGNAIVGSIFSLALVLFAIAGWQTDETAYAPKQTSAQTFSFQEPPSSRASSSSFINLQAAKVIGPRDTPGLVLRADSGDRVKSFCNPVRRFVS